MQIVDTRQRVGIVMIILAMLMASLAIAAPEANAAGNPYSQYRFVFANGQVLEGSTQGTGGGFEAPVFDTGNTVHVSCSDVFESGWSSSGGFPQPSDGAGWEILSYTIDRYKGNGTYHFTCGETFTKASITVLKDAAPASESFDFALTGTTNGGTGSYDGGTQNVLGDATDSYTWSDLEAGTYTLSELMSIAQIDAGWIFTGVTCSGATYSAGNEAATIYLDGGDNASCTFSDELEEQPDPVTVAVSTGSCVWDGQVSLTPVSFSSNPAGGATITIVDGDNTVVASGSSGSVDLGPGSYSWTATASEGFELTGTTNGTIPVEGCEPPPEDVTVSVDPGQCVWDGEASTTEVTFTIDPASGATISINGPDGNVGVYTESGSVTVSPGDYSWSAVAADGYVLVGSSTGNFTALDCEVPPETVTVDVAVGTCQYLDGVSVTALTASINPDGAATIVVDGSINLTFDGQTVNVGPGDHSWTATAAEGYVIEGSSGAEFTTEACPPLGSIGDTVWHDLDADGTQDDGEPGVEGIVVSLIVDGTAVATDTTDANGNYLFEDLAEGDYSVSFDIPAPWVVTAQDVGDDAADSDADAAGATETIALGVGEDNLTIDAGLVLPATIIVEKLTDPVAEGTFAFTGDIAAELGHEDSASSEVLPGTYTVTETVPEGWALIDISCTAGGSGDVDTGTATYTVASGDEVTCTYTNTNEGTVIIEKVTDVETDDVFTINVGDQTVEIGSGDSVELNLPSGDYTITEDLLVVDGWDLASIVCSGDSEADGEGVSLFVPPNETVGCTFVNAEAEAPLGVVGDFVWNDTNADGIQDANEPGLAGVTVELIDAASGDVIISTTSNDAGVYVLANVPEGDYVMEFTVPEPWLFSPANVGTDAAIDSNVVEIVGDTASAMALLQTGPTTGRTAQFFMPAGSVDTTVDAGVYQVEVLPEPPVTNPEPPTVTPPVEVEDTKVLGIQETLPATGFDDWQLAVLAMAMMMAGAGVLMLVRKEDLVIVTKGFGGRLS